MLPTTTRTSRYSLLTIGQLVVSISGLAGILLSAALGLFLNKLSIAQPGVYEAVNLPGATRYWASGLLALLCVRSIIVALRKLRGVQPRQVPEKWLRFSVWLIILWIGLGALTGYLTTHGMPAFLESPLYILLVAIPLIILLAFGLRRIQFGTVQHFWGLLTGSFFITSPLIILVEMMVLIAVFLLIGLNIASRPEILQLFSGVSRTGQLSQQTLNTLTAQLSPLLSTPVVIYGILFGFCLLVPVIEELLKPLMIWAFGRRTLTPAQGFGMGLICGAAFAMLESSSALGVVPGDAAIVLVFARAGTGLLHTLNSGLMGWAIVSAWRDGNALRTVLVYAGTVLMHGLWNFSALLLGVAALPVTFKADVSSLSAAAPWMLGLLVIWMLTIFWAMKEHLKAETPPPLVPIET